MDDNAPEQKPPGFGIVITVRVSSAIASINAWMHKPAECRAETVLDRVGVPVFDALRNSFQRHLDIKPDQNQNSDDPGFRVVVS